MRQIAGSPIQQLFTPNLVVGTLLLWLVFFVSLLVFYLLMSRVPTRLNTAGQTPKSASLIALMLPVGSMVGAIGSRDVARHQMRVSAVS